MFSTLQSSGANLKNEVWAACSWQRSRWSSSAAALGPFKRNIQFMPTRLVAERNQLPKRSPRKWKYCMRKGSARPPEPGHSLAQTAEERTVQGGANT